MFTAEGKLLYLSESVSEHLGHSMVSTESLCILGCGICGINELSATETLRVTGGVCVCGESALRKAIGHRLALAVFTNDHLSFHSSRWTWLPRVTVSTTSLTLLTI